MTNSDLKVIHKKEDAEFLTVGQLSQFLNVSSHTIYHWSMKRTIPCFKVGKLLRFNKAEIIHWMQSKKVEPSI